MASEVAGEHLQKQTLTILVFAPDHPDRTSSAVFGRTRDKLIKHNPAAKCYIDNEHCDHDHPMELHHQFVEWCDSEAVDWRKVAELCPDFEWEHFNPDHPETFVDSEANARMVLCKRHHVGKDHGIHMLPWPLWNLQKVKKKDFVFSPDEEPTLPGL